MATMKSAGTILVVDDSQTNVRLLKAQLEAEEMHVVCAFNGLEALELLKTQNVAVIVSDILMPKMDGYKLCFELRKNDRWKTIPFIFYTATYTSPADEKFALALGAEAFLRKPATVEIILQTLREVLHNQLSPRREKVSMEFLEQDVLREYSERLVAKLEGKNVELTELAEKLKSSQRAATIAHDRINDIFENLDEVFFSFDTVNNVYRQVSPACQKLYGYPREAFFKNPTLWMEVVHPEDKPRVESDNSRIMEGKPLQWECRIIRPDGVTRWIDSKVKPKLSESGNVVRIDALVTDITARKEAEENFRNSEKQLSLVFKHVSDMIIFLAVEADENLRIISVNPAFLKVTGFLEKEVVGRLLQEVISDPAVRIFLENSRKSVRQRNAVQWEQTLVFPAGTKHGEISVTPVFDAKGECKNLIGTVHDLTVRRQIEQQVRQAQKLESIGTLASGIAHDFNNILGIIMGHLYQMRPIAGKPPGAENLKKSIDIVQRATERGAALVKQLLTFARKSEILLASVLMNEVIEELVKLLYETFPRTVAVSTKLQPKLPSILGDANQLHQVLLNLCVNARDAMPSGGTLDMKSLVVSLDDVRQRHKSASAAEYVLITITDTGTGMDEVTRARLFEPFFTTKDIGKGTGLGLATSYGIIESHNGFLEVESELGKGTTFSIYLPVQPPTIIMPEETKKSFETESEGGTETVLLIEDEAVMRELLKALLLAKGYTILTADNGFEGIKLFTERHDDIAVVVTDVGLPKIGGGEVFKRLREVDASIPVIIASGYIDPSVKADLYKAGALHFIQKPYHPNEVLRAIRKVVDTAKRQQ